MSQGEQPEEEDVEEEDAEEPSDWAQKALSHRVRKHQKADCVTRELTFAKVQQVRMKVPSMGPAAAMG